MYSLGNLNTDKHEQDGVSLPLWNVRSTCHDTQPATTLTCNNRFPQKVNLVLRATRHHATNLARFALIYKLTMLALKYLGAEPGKEGTSSSPKLNLSMLHRILTMNRNIRLLRWWSCGRIFRLRRSFQAYGEDLIGQPADRHLRLCASDARTRPYRCEARPRIPIRVVRTSPWNH